MRIEEARAVHLAPAEHFLQPLVAVGLRQPGRHGTDEIGRQVGPLLLADAEPAPAGWDVFGPDRALSFIPTQTYESTPASGTTALAA